MQVTAIYRYPVKSLGGELLPKAAPFERGMADDRRWMLIDEAGQFISQRTQPHLARFYARIIGDCGLGFFRVSDDSLLVEIAEARPTVGKEEWVTVWDDRFRAPVIESKELGRALSLPAVRLAYMHDGVERRVDPRYAIHRERVSFADGYPYLITTTGSLDDLSRRYGRELDVRRFRPNLVIESPLPYKEDSWQELQIGTNSFYLPKPCARCIMVTSDPETGVRDPEVFSHLAAYRNQGRKVLFGVNAIWSGGQGVIRVGDSVTAT